MNAAPQTNAKRYLQMSVSVSREEPAQVTNSERGQLTTRSGQFQRLRQLPFAVWRAGPPIGAERRRPSRKLLVWKKVLFQPHPGRRGLERTSPVVSNPSTLKLGPHHRGRVLHHFIQYKS